MSTSTSTPSSSSLLPDLVAPPPPPPAQLTPLVDMASSAAQLERRVARALSLEVAEQSGEELRGETGEVLFLRGSFFFSPSARPRKTSTLNPSPASVEKKNSIPTQLPPSHSSAASPWQWHREPQQKKKQRRKKQKRKREEKSRKSGHTLRPRPRRPRRRRRLHASSLRPRSEPLSSRRP